MAVHVIRELPPGCVEIDRIDLQHDRRTAMVVNAAALVVMIAMGFGMNFVIPVAEMFDVENGWIPVVVRLLVMTAGYLAYIVLHELTHAAVMRLFGAGKMCFGFSGLYAYASSKEDWFDKLSYILVALAPLIIWTLVFGLLQILLPRPWAWVVWFWQIGNVSGAAGDVYVVIRLSKHRGEVWIRDTGYEMSVWRNGRGA